MFKNKEKVQEVQEQAIMYTEDQLMARLRFFIGICLALTLTGIVFVVLYSIIFVTQPLNAISPIDSKFFELIIPIATFLTGTLSGIMLAGGNKDLQAEALKAATSKSPTAPTTPSMPVRSPMMSGAPSMSSMAPRPMPSFAPMQNEYAEAPGLDPNDPPVRNTRND
jgi:hypothetical protein